jgi:hypothetical protein
MGTALGARFLRRVRDGFASLFRHYGFIEVGSEDHLSYASLTVKNATHYLRMSCDFRDRFIDVAVGQLAEDVVPPLPIAPPRTPSEVREIPGAIIIWLATGDKAGAFGMCEYTTEESLDISVSRLAKALGEYGRRLLAGDRGEWERAAELTVTRQWQPSNGVELG